LVDDGKDILIQSPPGAGSVASTEVHDKLRDSLFTATLITGDGLMHWEIADHTANGGGNNSTWKELVACLICGTTIE
jgi:hypothetical protein